MTRRLLAWDMTKGKLGLLILRECGEPQQTHSVNTRLYNIVRRLFSQRCEKDVRAMLPQCKMTMLQCTCVCVGVCVWVCVCVQLDDDTIITSNMYSLFQCWILCIFFVCKWADERYTQCLPESKCWSSSQYNCYFALSVCNHCHVIKDWSLVTGRGGAT